MKVTLFLIACLLGVLLGAECVVINTHRHGLHQVPHVWQAWATEQPKEGSDAK